MHVGKPRHQLLTSPHKPVPPQIILRIKSLERIHSFYIRIRSHLTKYLVLTPPSNMPYLAINETIIRQPLITEVNLYLPIIWKLHIRSSHKRLSDIEGKLHT